MGTELSSQRNRTVSPCDEGMTHRIRNNFCPLNFHFVHGDNVKLRKDGRVACRSEGFCKGIVFSDRPVAVGEPIYIKFTEISSNWSGALRIGFTMNDPELVKLKLPRYACPDLTSVPGNWAKAIAERMAKKDSILYYFVDENGDVHYGIDSEEYGVFFGGINTSSKLWALIDIYGNTVAIEFINPNTLNLDSISESQSNRNSLLSLASGTEIQNPSAPSQGDYSPFLLHSLHGKNVVVNQRIVAARKPGSESLAYVFTERSLTLGEHVCVQVVQIDTKSNKKLVFGITSCDPSTLNPNDLPEVEDDLLDRPEYWVVENDSNMYEVGDVIKYHISVEGKFSVLKNNRKSAELHIDPTQPIWLFLNVTGYVSGVRLLGNDIVSQFEEMMLSDQPNSNSAVPGTSRQQNLSECAICYEESVDCALYRCGHMCMCYNCAYKIWQSNPQVQCPICRKQIEDVIRIYK